MKKKLICSLMAAMIFTYCGAGYVYDIKPYAQVKEENLSLDNENLHELNDKIKDKARILVSGESSKAKAASVQYAISDGDKIITSDNVGVYSKREDRLLTKDNMYGIGSVSKMFTTCAVMQLVDEKKIDLDLPLTNYIKDFNMADERYKKITPRMLLNHSSGIMTGGFRNSDFLNDKDTSLHDNFIESMKNQKLISDPGEYSVYSNSGFMLAQILVERVSGMSFSEYVEKNISEPLGLTHTKTPINFTDKDNSLLAKTYSFSPYKEDPTECCMALGSAGMYSSAEDLCKFGSALTKKDGSGLLSPRSESLMEEREYLKGLWPCCGNNEEDGNYGYGLGWDNVDLFPFNKYGIKALVKSGHTVSYYSCLIVLPELNITMAVTSSGGSNDFNKAFAESALLEILKEKGIIDEIKEDVHWSEEKSNYMPRELKEKYEGIYTTGSNIVQVNISDEGTLEYIDPYNDKPIVGHYTYSGYFIPKDGNYGIKFVEGENGKIYIQEKSYYKPDAELTQQVSFKFLAEKVEDNSSKLSEKWVERSKKSFYVLNEKYSSVNYCGGVVRMCSHLIPDSHGYLFGSKIIDDNRAEPIAQIPVLGGNGLMDYNFYTKDGVEYAELPSFGYKFVSSDGVPSLDEGVKEVTIGEDGYTKWFTVPESMEGKAIVADCPNNSTFAVYSREGACINNSYVSKEKSVILKAGESIAFAGDPKVNFKIAFK